MRIKSILFVLFLVRAIAAQTSGATPIITSGGVVNAASYLANLAPGALATVYGSQLADGTTAVAASNGFPTQAGGVTVTVNGVNAPLIYVSPTQINLQIPWETPAGSSVPVVVTRDKTPSAPESVTIAAPEAPSMFLNDIVDGVAWVTGPQCVTTECAVAVGGSYQLWANGLGPKNAPLQDGMPAVYSGSLTPLEVPGSPASCQLTIGGQTATVQYCGAAPGEIIDQINFVYPSIPVISCSPQASPCHGAGVSASAPFVPASLTIGGVTGNFHVPAPGTPDQLAQQTLAMMTQDEKLQLVYGAGGPVTNIIPLPRGAGGYIPGIPRLGIPDLYFNDGSVGVANSQAPATALPSAIASAATWDTNLAYSYGQVIGAEMKAYGLNVNLGGNVNLNREPRDGRTFEAKGEDPILAGKINAAHLRAIQDQQVVGCIKHYAFNDQETGRTTANAIIDERSGRETDLLAFEIGVRDANVQSVMCSYNLLNGTYACENAHLLSDILKGDWGFPGFVMSDWWADHSTVAAANAGLDQEQPDDQYFSQLEAAIQAGQVPQSRLDNMVERILRALYATGAINSTGAVTPVNTAADQAIAQQVEEQGAVLLKNANNQLPLNPATVSSIAIIGSHADIGVLSGGGSAQVYPTGGAALNEGYPVVPGWSPVIWDPSSPLQAIQAMAPNAKVQFNNGNNVGAADVLAAASSVAIVFVSQWTSEGMDMPSLNFTDVIHATPIEQDGLVNAVAANNPHTIVVMENGGAQVLPWLSQVNAVLEAWFPGQRGGQAIANILFGAVNPSGKLPVTFPVSEADLPHPTIAAPNPPDSTAPFPVDYSEGLLVGYKWYDANNLPVVFPFGFGLSYTTFSIANAALTNNLTSSNPNFQVTCDLTNTGSVSGAEVVQVYLGMPANLGEPPKRLVGWQKVTLQPGAKQHVTIEVDEGDSSHPMSWWNVAAGAWQVGPGTYTVYVGTSEAAGDLTVAGTLQVGN
jgi:beta-glucosidase